jgi:hypothetical protein
MSIIIDTTPSSQTANSYNTVAEISTYAPTTIWSALWQSILDAGDDDATASWLVRGARYLDWMPFPGRKTDVTQPLQWPRIGAYYPDGSLVDIMSIPREVKTAHAHLTLYLASYGDNDPFQVDSKAQIVRKTIGPLTTEYRPSTGPAGYLLLQTIIAPFLAPSGMVLSPGTVRLVR